MPRLLPALVSFSAALTIALAAPAAAAPVVPLPKVPAPAPATAPPGPGPGYWLVGGDGGVFPFGRGAYKGGMADRHTNAPIVAAAVTPTGLGYWLVSSDGGVFAFGDAPWRGSLSAGALKSRVVAIAATADGKGYWLAASDGAVYAFGDATYLGGLGGKTTPAPIVAMAATPAGAGYWLAAADGAVYAFGDAPYLGGASGSALQGRIVGFAPTPAGKGYWLAGADGGVFGFGDAAWLGGLSGRPHARIVGIASAPQGNGFWLAASDGGVFGFGDAGYFGSVGSARLNRGIVTIVGGDGVAIPTAPSAPGAAGFDISWPQCGGRRPAPPYGFGVVGVTGGQLFTANPCLPEQWRWATTYGSFGAVYVNTNAPTAAQWASFANVSGCHTDAGCLLDRWGRRGVDQALNDAGNISAPMWWLDVETGNEWLPDKHANAVVIAAMIDELRLAGRSVGIYSTSLQWDAIAGDFGPKLPTWIPGAPPSDPRSYCSGHSFGGGSAWMTQSGDANFDTDVLCGAGMARYQTAFARPAPPQVPEYAVPASLNSNSPAPFPAAPVAPVPRVGAAPSPAAEAVLGPLPPHSSHRFIDWWEVVAAALLFAAGARRSARRERS